MTIAHKKVLHPINDLNSKPDLNALLAKEEAKEAAENPASAVVTGDATVPTEPAAPAAEAPAAPAPAPADDAPAAPPAGHTVAPQTTENSIPPSSKDDFDPNNIAL